MDIPVDASTHYHLLGADGVAADNQDLHGADPPPPNPPSTQMEMVSIRELKAGDQVTYSLTSVFPTDVLIFVIQDQPGVGHVWTEVGHLQKGAQFRMTERQPYPNYPAIDIRPYSDDHKPQFVYTHHLADEIPKDIQLYLSVEWADKLPPWLTKEAQKVFEKNVDPTPHTASS